MTESVPGGAFFVFEGIGGCGKSTQSRMFAESLRELGYDVIETRQPGGTPVGQRIRDMVLDPELSNSIGPEAQLLMFTADRRVHLETVLKPNLVEGRVVICDRYIYSSYAYQGAQGSIRSDLDYLNKIASGGLRPLRCYWLDVPPPEARSRRAKASRVEADRYDMAGLAFDRLVATLYAAQWQSAPHEICQVDGRQSLERVAGLILEDALRHIEFKMKGR